MKRRLALILTLALTALYPACNGQNVTPASVASAAMNMIQNASAPKGPQVGWTYAQVVAYQGRPQRVYGAGTPVMVYPLPNDATQRIGVSGIDNNSKVLWIKTLDSMNHEIKT